MINGLDKGGKLVISLPGPGTLEWMDVLCELRVERAGREEETQWAPITPIEQRTES